MSELNLANMRTRHFADDTYKLSLRKLTDRELLAEYGEKKREIHYFKRRVKDESVCQESFQIKLFFAEENLIDIMSESKNREFPW